MKYWIGFVIVGIIVFCIWGSLTPSKCLKCSDDMCMILEKTKFKPKAVIKQYFFRSDVLDVDIVSQDGKDFLVIKTKTQGDIYLKFIHTQETAFKNRNVLRKEIRKSFLALMRNKKEYQSKWMKDVGAFQIYVFGKPLFE